MVESQVVDGCRASPWHHPSAQPYYVLMFVSIVSHPGRSHLRKAECRAAGLEHVSSYVLITYQAFLLLSRKNPKITLM